MTFDVGAAYNSWLNQRMRDEHLIQRSRRMNITTQAPASDFGVPADIRVGDEVEVTGTARVVGIQEKLEVNVYPGAEQPAPELVVTLALEVRPA